MHVRPGYAIGSMQARDDGKMNVAIFLCKEPAACLGGGVGADNGTLCKEPSVCPARSIDDDGAVCTEGYRGTLCGECELNDYSL